MFINHIKPPETARKTVGRKTNRFINNNRIPLIQFRHECNKSCSGVSCSDFMNSVETEANKSINDVNQDHEGFEKIRVQVDSGALDTAGPKSVVRAFNIKETHASTHGKQLRGSQWINN